MDGCPLVLVEWEDSAQPVAAWQWLSTCQQFPVVTCRSVGWLVHDGDDVKALAPNMGHLPDDDDAQISGLIRISARSIIKIVPLAEPPTAAT